MPCIDLEIRLQPLSSFHQGCWKGNSDYKRKWSAYYALTLNPNLVCISILRVLIFHVFSLRASCVRFLSGERGTIGGLLELRASLMSLILFVFSLSWCGSTSKYVNVFMMTAASFHSNCGSPNVAVKAHESRLVTFFFGFWSLSVNKSHHQRLLSKTGCGFSGKLENWWFTDNVHDPSTMCCCVFEELHITLRHESVFDQNTWKILWLSKLLNP